MDKNNLIKVLESVKENKISIEEALQKIKFLPFEDIGFAKIDHHRALRRGFPEVIFCQNKTIGQVTALSGSWHRTTLMCLQPGQPWACLKRLRSTLKARNTMRFQKQSSSIKIK